MTTKSQLIAVIDDDPGVLQSTGRLLRLYGFQVLLFESAAQFLIAAATCGAQCLLVDLQLGAGSGVDLVEHLAGKGLRFPVVFMTGSDDAALLARAVQSGYSCVQKPFTGDALVDAITWAMLTLR